MPTSRTTDNVAKKPKKQITNVCKKKKNGPKQDNEKTLKPKKTKKISVVAKKVKTIEKKERKMIKKSDANKTAKVIKKKTKNVLNSKLLTSQQSKKCDETDGKKIKKTVAVKKGKNTKKQETDDPKNKPVVTETEEVKDDLKKCDKKKVTKGKPKVVGKRVTKGDKSKVRVQKKSKIIEKIISEIKLEPDVTKMEPIENIVDHLKNCEKIEIKKEMDVIDSKETIAKLLKEANKSILKGTNKKKRDPLKVNLAGVIHKKPKITKVKPKKAEIKQEYEEEVVFADIKQVAKLLKPIKKIVKKETKESQMKESQTKESLMKEIQMKESQKESQRESQMKESQMKESQLKESQMKESQMKESQMKESQMKESQTKESQMRESQTKESQMKESLMKESQMRETKDSQMKETKESQMKESQTKESQIRESQTRESQLKETRESQMKETKESQMKETKESQMRETKESQMRENQMKESQMKESQMKENQMRESQMRESQIKESQTKESQSKETQAKEGQRRESQTKEGQRRESQTKEGQSKEVQKLVYDEKLVKEDEKVTDDSSTDEMTLGELQNQTDTDDEVVPQKKVTKNIKKEQISDTEKKSKPKVTKSKVSRKVPQKKKVLIIKKRIMKQTKPSSPDIDQKNRRLKVFGFWNGPKRHRVASLNALAKVHCLYENESRGALYDVIKRSPPPKESSSEKEITEPPPAPVVSTRTLRSVPGLRGVGKHWEMHDETSSSSDDNGNESSLEGSTKAWSPPPSYKQKQKEILKNIKPETKKEPKKPEIKKEIKKPEPKVIEDKPKKKIIRKRRTNKTELIMDLKDMVVRKRMASLNASAILAASYSVEKRPMRSPQSEDSSESDTSIESDESSLSLSSDDSKRHCYEADIKKEDDRKVIEVHASPNKKVAVILNQDTDVTITGVYVNSTTRSTHHEGFCSIAGMQYRISATSHTQTNAVSTETLLHSTANPTKGEAPLSAPCKSYTPLGALTNMQPPGAHAPPSALSPSGRRHGCSSAFSAPPAYGPPPPHHRPHHPPPPTHEQPPPGYIHGYYQPAGPLITTHHTHPHQPVPSGKTVTTIETSPSPTPTPNTHQTAANSTGDSSDNEVIITSRTSSSEPAAVPPQPIAQPYRYAAQYPPAGTHAPPGYPYTYPPSQYYHGAPTGFAQTQHFHHDICYPPSGYPTSYLHPKAYTTTFRRYLPAPPPAGPQYYATSSELYPPPTSNPQNSQIITSGSSSNSSNYQPLTGPPPPNLVEGYVPPPPTIVDPYPPPHYYAGYAAGPAGPACYTHSQPTRTFIDPAYQSCPCPMQSCPKNVHTGPLTGDGKRSNMTTIVKESVPLPPVALALPLEPASVIGPPSPARGSAGMPPPPSPAGATYQPVNAHKWDTKQETIEVPVDTIPTEKRRKARVGKTMARNNITSNFNTIPEQHTMLLMCHNPQPENDVSEVKREIESPEMNSLSEISKDERIPKLEDDTKCEELEDKETINETVLKNTTNDIRLNCKETSQKLEGDDHEDQCIPIDSTPTRRKSIESDTNDTLPNENNQTDKKVCLKRKLSSDEIVEKNEIVKAGGKKIKLTESKTSDEIKKINRTNKPQNVKRRPSNKEPSTPVASKLKKTKRKSDAKDDTIKKKQKSNPLIASNLHNSKQNKKSNKKDTIVQTATETSKKLCQKKIKTPVNLKSKKITPKVIPTVFVKNNVDETIESVVLSSVIPDETVEPVETPEVLIESDETCTEIKVQDPQDQSEIKVPVSKPQEPKNIKTNCAKATVKRKKSKTNNNNNNNTSNNNNISNTTKIVDVAVITPKVPKKFIHTPKWSNGWSWEGSPFPGKVFLNSDEVMVVRTCYPAMRHIEGDLITPRDSVLLKAGPRKIDLPFVAKVAALWENPEDGEMMMSLLWYYRPEHTEQGRLPSDQPDEVFASRHKDTNSVACIEDKCYVLTYNEYCRYRKTVRRIEEGMEEYGPVVPLPDGGTYHRSHRQPPISPDGATSPDLVFFCRRVYDFRQKRLVKNPS